MSRWADSSTKMKTINRTVLQFCSSSKKCTPNIDFLSYSWRGTQLSFPPDSASTSSSGRTTLSTTHTRFLHLHFLHFLHMSILQVKTAPSPAAPHQLQILVLPVLVCQQQKRLTAAHDLELCSHEQDVVEENNYERRAFTRRNLQQHDRHPDSRQ